MGSPRTVRRTAALLAGLAVALGLTAPSPRPAAAQPKSGTELPADLAMVPADALGFVHVRVGDLYRSEHFREARQLLAKAGEDALKGLAEVNLTHPTDSHPPLGLRLKSLGTDLERVSRAALQTTPDDAAIHLIKEPEKIEEEINHAYHGQLARELGLVASTNQ